MHCPGCGTVIGSEAVSYCTRCGLTLGPVRAAMVGKTDEPQVATRAVRIGAGAMLTVLLPTLLMLAVTSASMLPLAFGIATAGLAAIWIGAKPLLKLLRPDDAAGHGADFAARLTEMRFGASASYFTALLATLLTAVVVPDSFVPVALFTLVPGLCFLIFVLSGGLFQRLSPAFGFGRAAFGRGNDMPLTALESAPTTKQLEYQPPVGIAADLSREPVYAKEVPRVTEATTRDLS